MLPCQLRINCCFNFDRVVLSPEALAWYQQQCHRLLSLWGRCCYERILVFWPDATIRNCLGRDL